MRNSVKLNYKVNEWCNVLYSYIKDKTTDEVYFIKTHNYMGRSQSEKYINTCVQNIKEKDKKTISERFDKLKAVNSNSDFSKFEDEYAKTKVNNFIFFASPENNCAHMIIKSFDKCGFNNYADIKNTFTSVRFYTVYRDNTDKKTGFDSLYLSMTDILDKDHHMSKVPEKLVIFGNNSMYIVDGKKLVNYLHDKKIFNHYVCPLITGEEYVEAKISKDSIGYFCNGNMMNIQNMPNKKEFEKATIGVPLMSKGGKTRKVHIKITCDDIVFEDDFNSIGQAAEAVSRAVGRNVSRKFLTSKLNKECVLTTENTHKVVSIIINEITHICASDSKCGAPTKYSTYYNIYYGNNFSQFLNSDRSYSLYLFGRCSTELLKNAHYVLIDTNNLFKSSKQSAII